MTMQHTALALALLAGLTAGPAQAQAQSATRYADISFTNMFGSAESGSAENSSFSVQLAPLAYLQGLTWTVQLTAFDPSWLSEIAVALTNSRGEGVLLSPLDGVNRAGSQGGSGALDLVNSGSGFRLQSDGRLQLTFVDTFDDLANMPDSRWDSATLRIAYTAPVPEPAAGLLLASGLAVLAWRRRGRPAGAAPTQAT